MLWPNDHPPSRREALQRLACGFGGLGLAAVLADEAAAAGPARPPGPHHPAKAKSLIFLHMQGGPSQFETFDYKPEMAKWAGKTSGVAAGAAARTSAAAPVLPPFFKYVRKGEAGLATTEIFPHMAEVLDELCVVRSMVSDSPAHESAQRQALTGYARQPMPSLGSWLLYGLGSENRDLPGFVYLAQGTHHGSGFLPAATQGMPVGHRLPNLHRPAGLSEDAQRGQLDLIGELNRGFADRHPTVDPLDARVAAAELAFRMQMSCPEAVAVGRESAATLKLYGVTDPPGERGKDRGATRGMGETNVQFGTMCLVARRLVERGVRVVSLSVGGLRGWDHHSNLRDGMRHNAGVVDKAMAGLLTDLKARGLLDTTLVVWGGEFGRTSYAENGTGRDHFAKGYTCWLAGGGVNKGRYYGETNETGVAVTKDPVHVHDLHATILHLMGLDHERLTYRYAGRDHRLTDVTGKVVRGLIA